MGYKTIYSQVICCYAKHCSSEVKKQFEIYLLVSFHQSTFAGGNPEVRIGFYAVLYRFSQFSLSKEKVMLW